MFGLNKIIKKKHKKKKLQLLLIIPRQVLYFIKIIIYLVQTDTSFFNENNKNLFFQFF